MYYLLKTPLVLVETVVASLYLRNQKEHCAIRIQNSEHRYLEDKVLMVHTDSSKSHQKCRHSYLLCDWDGG